MRSYIYWILTTASSFSRWSTLAQFGRSRVAKLTILVPFIGYLIIFNIHIGHWIETTLGLGLNLYFMYFGLMFLGAGSLIFAVFSPKQIRVFNSALDYINYMSSISTRNVVRASLTNILGIYVTSNDDETASALYSYRSLAFPESISSLFHGFIDHIFSISNFDEETAEGFASSDEPEVFPPIYSGSGYLLTDSIAKRFYQNHKMDLGLTYPLNESAIKQEKDIFFLEYEMLDFSMTSIRLITMLFYASGFLIMFIPTVTTSIKILSQLF